MSDDLEARVARLEGRVRSWRRAAFVAAVGLVGLVTIGAGNGAPDVIEARAFRVVNEQGKAMVTLFHQDGAGALALSTGDEKPYFAVMSAEKGGRFLMLRDGQGRAAATLGCASDGERALVLTSETGTRAVVLGVTPQEGDGGLQITSHDGRTREIDAYRNRVVRGK